MLANYPILYIARLVLETRTPLSIGAGRGEGIFDTMLVRDANGLPTIPGSSFAGVLRHLYQHNYGEEFTDSLFGHANKNSEQPSQVHVSWGCIHNTQNQPIEGLEHNSARLKNDLLLADALQLTPIVRDHVRLTHRGVAKDQGKFDRTSLRAGHRFSIELSLWSDNPKDERWDKLLNLLNRPDFRLGGATRRGLGALRVIKLRTRQFNLKEPKDFADYTEKFSNQLADTNEFTERTLLKTDEFPQAKIRIKPRDGYRFGQGAEPFGTEEADLLPISEHKIKWKDNKGSVTNERYIVIPASAVKGALSHRVAFHYNALTGQFADKTPQPDYDKAENNAVKSLFGFAKEDGGGQVGHLLLDDLYIKPNANQAITLQHNSIDRFTGGVREHMLFNEEFVGQKTVLDFSLTVITPFLNEEPTIRQALAMTLADLVEGRLALGAGSGRGGYGYFNGRLEWTDNEAWINQ